MIDLISKKQVLDILYYHTCSGYRDVDGDYYPPTIRIDARKEIEDLIPEDMCSKCDAWNVYKNYSHAGLDIGIWNIDASFDDCYYARCSKCGTTQVFYYGKPLTKFCPECGTKMQGEQ